MHQAKPFDLTGIVGQSTTEELFILDEAITEAEVLRECRGGKASGPDGLPIEFYRFFWQIIKADIMDMLREFAKGNINLRCLNKVAITLIPKKLNPDRVSDYRPISVINTVAKIVTKVMANILKSHINNLIAHNQTAFVQGRSLMESFLSAREYLLEEKNTGNPLQAGF